MEAAMDGKYEDPNLQADFMAEEFCDPALVKSAPGDMLEQVAVNVVKGFSFGLPALSNINY